jgi:large subunit ribosomal protein L24
MSTIKKIIKGDLVKLISGAKKGTTGKVLQVLTKKNAVLVEGIGVMHRKIKPNLQNPRGGQKDIHVPTPISKIALVIDDKTGKTSRIGLIKNEAGKTVRVARSNNNKEVKSNG